MSMASIAVSMGSCPWRVNTTVQIVTSVVALTGTG